jgi:hypothetical protein
LKDFSASDAHNLNLLLPYGTGYQRAGTKSISLQEKFERMKKVAIPVLERILGKENSVVKDKYTLLADLEVQLDAENDKDADAIPDE